MKASELIKELETLIEKHGDLPVCHVDDGAEGPFDVEVSEPETALGYDSEFREVPKRIKITSA
jgi:hypothetical protein